MNKRGWPYRPSREPKRDGRYVVFPGLVISPYETMFMFNGMTHRLAWSVSYSGDTIAHGRGKSYRRAQRLATRAITKHERQEAYKKHKVNE